MSRGRSRTLRTRRRGRRRRRGMGWRLLGRVESLGLAWSCSEVGIGACVCPGWVIYLHKDKSRKRGCSLHGFPATSQTLAKLALP